MALEEIFRDQQKFKTREIAIGNQDFKKIEKYIIENDLIKNKELFSEYNIIYRMFLVYNKEEKYYKLHIVLKKPNTQYCANTRIYLGKDINKIIGVGI